MRVRSWGGALALLVLTIGLVPLASAAPLDEIREKRAAVEQAKAEYDRLGLALEPAIARYDAAMAELAAVRQRIDENRSRIAAVRQSTSVSQRQLSERIVDAYKYGDQDVVATLMGAGSISDVLDVADFLRRSQGQAAELIRELRAAKAELAKREADLEEAEQRAAELTARAEAERERIEQGMVAQQAAIKGFEAEIRQLQQEELERQRRLAEEARRRLEAERAMREAAAAAAAAQAPDIGGAAPAIGEGGGASGASPGSDGGASGAAPAPAAPAPPETIPAPPPTDGSRGARAVAAAMRYLGTPYSWGGGNASGPSRGIGRGAGTVGFDCSGLTLYAWAQAGVSLSHFTGSQWNEGARISSMGDLIPGDLVFFGSDLGHMGMYIGGGQMIHAPQTGDVVKISSITSGYYVARFRGGVRPG